MLKIHIKKLIEKLDFDIYIFLHILYKSMCHKYAILVYRNDT